MSPNEKSERIAERKLPDFRVTKEQLQEMKTTSAILAMLSENPELTKKIANEFVLASSAKRDDKLIAAMELKQKVTEMVASKLKTVSHEDIEMAYMNWGNHIMQHFIISRADPARSININLGDLQQYR